MAKEDETVIYMRNMGLLHIQRERQVAFEEFAAHFAYCFSVFAIRHDNPAGLQRVGPKLADGRVCRIVGAANLYPLKKGPPHLLRWANARAMSWACFPPYALVTARGIYPDTTRILSYSFYTGFVHPVRGHFQAAPGIRSARDTQHGIQHGDRQNTSRLAPMKLGDLQFGQSQHYKKSPTGYRRAKGGRSV